MRPLLPALLFSFHSLVAHGATPAQAAEGDILIRKLNCAACHDTFPNGIPGPDLANVSDRLDAAALESMIITPHRLRPASRMPGLFHPPGNNGEKPPGIAPLLHYLRSLKATTSVAKVPPGDPRKGGELFNTIGCRACHDSPGPANPAGAPPSAPLPMGVLPSHSELVAYLRSPGTDLMPALGLSPQEAADLSAWLHSHRGDHTPGDHPALDQDLIKRGRTLFRSLRCASCHESPENPLPAPPPIPIIDWEAGCLAPEPEKGAAHFAITRSQQDAIRAAARSTAPPSAAEHVDHFLTLYNCYACHERNGKGGPSDSLRAYFTATEQMAESYGDFGLLPPKLDHVGRKLTRGWLRKILLHGHGAVRPYLATRMPHYDIPTSEVEAFLDHLEQADLRNPPLSIDVSGLLGHQRGHYGRDLIGENGLNCITCHGLKEKRPRGAPSIDLTHTVTRLRPAYFKELLLDPQSVQPGTLMPTLFLNRPKAEQEVEQLWTYLKELDQRRLPDGLLNRGDFELKPSESGRPIILRTFMEHVGTHSIAVGYPEGTHFAFDAYSARWSLVWKGRFLDALSTWDDRYATPARPLGQELYRFPIQKSGREFLGYRLRNDGIPVFRYRENGTEIEDWVEIRPGGAIRRGLRRNGKVQHQNLQLEDEQALFRDAVKN